VDRKVALVTGASSGLGVAIVRELAARGYDIALTARSEAPMKQLAAEIRSAHEVSATVHPADLSEAGSVAALLRELEAQGISPDVLINNAAFGHAEPFVDLDPQRLAAMVQLNIASLAELTLCVGRRMRAQGAGHILLVSSTAAYQPTPSMAAYGASKAFVLSLGEALHVELSPSVTVTVLSPGLMETGFNKVTGYVPSKGANRFLMSAERVAKEGLDALFAGRSSIIPGAMNGLGAFSNRLMSRHAGAKLFYSVAHAK
jgi:hypothetical protein